MILTKSKIYELRLNEHKLLDKKMRKIYLENSNDWFLGMAYAAEEGYEKLVHFFISRSTVKGIDNLNCAMVRTAEGVHEKLLDFFISRGANDWNWGMASAAKEGHEKLVHFFISKGANAWNWGMYWTIDKGNEKLANFFKKKINLL